MNVNTKFLDLPSKYAFIAALIFAGSSFLLGYLYQFLALSAFHVSEIGASWPEIKHISGFSLDRILRYFIFYFLIFISLTCYIRSAAKDSPWGPVILFVIFPSLAGFIPFQFSTGEFTSSSFWSLQASFIALMFLGINHKSGTKTQRILFVGLLIVNIVLDQLGGATTWLNEAYKISSKLYGESAASEKAWSSLFYFAPAAIGSIIINIYIMYKIPFDFLAELDSAKE